MTTTAVCAWNVVDATARAVRARFFQCQMFGLGFEPRAKLASFHEISPAEILVP